MKDVVISGLGAMTSIGHHAEGFWEALLRGRTGAGKITAFDVSQYANQYGCEIDDLDAYGNLTEEVPGRATRIFLITLEDALHDAGLYSDKLDKYRIGICIGTTMGEMEPFEARMMGQDCRLQGGPNAIAEFSAKLYGLKGPVWTLTNACAAGNFAIARAMDEIQSGRADIMIAGGVDAMSWAAFTGFSSLRAMAPEICRPFDANRKGLLLGEGAGVVILESREHMLQRAGKARARLLGYGLSCDAHHITQPDPNAAGALIAIRAALTMGGVSKQDIGYVSAHGTGTIANDRMEARALYACFGETIKTSSIKGHIGHTLGAASVIEAVACVKAMETGILPPTANLNQKDPLCHVEVIANEPLPYQADFVLSNAYAFGGINSSILLGRA